MIVEDRFRNVAEVYFNMAFYDNDFQPVKLKTQKEKDIEWIAYALQKYSQDLIETSRL